MIAGQVEPLEFEQVPVGELRRLRALARIASPQELARAEADHAVIIDLQWLQFCDASVVNTFILVHRYGREWHVTVELAGARGRVTHLFGLLGLEKALSLRTDVYEAVRTLQDQDVQAKSASVHRSSVGAVRRSAAQASPHRGGPAQS